MTIAELMECGYSAAESLRLATTFCPCGGELPFYEEPSLNVYVCSDCWGEMYP